MTESAISTGYQEFLFWLSWFHVVMNKVERPSQLMLSRFSLTKIYVARSQRLLALDIPLLVIMWFNAIIRYMERKHPFAFVSEHMMGRPQVLDGQPLRGVPLEVFKTYHLGNSSVPLVEYRSKRTKTARKCHHFRPLNSMHVFIAFGIRVVDIVGFIVHLYH